MRTTHLKWYGGLVAGVSFAGALVVFLLMTFNVAEFHRMNQPLRNSGLILVSTTNATISVDRDTLAALDQYGRDQRWKETRAVNIPMLILSMALALVANLTIRLTRATIRIRGGKDT